MSMCSFLGGAVVVHVANEVGAEAAAGLILPDVGTGLISQEEPDSLAMHLTSHLTSLNLPIPSDAAPPTSATPSAPAALTPTFISPAALPPPSSANPHIPHPPTLYSSSLISQSDDPEDQTVLVLPDWKVVHDVENSKDGVKGLWEGVLANELGRAGGRVQKGEVGRRRSWVLPYRAVVLLCELVRHQPLAARCLYTVTQGRRPRSEVGHDTLET